MVTLKYISYSLLLLLLADYYIWVFFISEKKLWIKITFWIPDILLVSSIAAGWFVGLEGKLFALVLILILCFSLPKVIFTLFSLLGKLFAKHYKRINYVIVAIGLGISICITLFAFYGLFFGWKKTTITKFEIANAQIPKSFDGYRIVQISDLHLGTFGNNTTFVTKVVEKINQLHPDIIVFTGDLVNSSSKEIQPFSAILTKLQAPDGVFSVMGNHDYGDYKFFPTSEARKEDCRKLRQYEHAMGWQLLSNDNHVIHRGTDSIAVLGVENNGRSPFPALASLNTTLKNLSSKCYKVLLSHDPSFWEDSVITKTDIPLTLSGHTHALQLKIGSFSPAKWIYSQWGGRYDHGNHTLLVNTGIGGSFLFRIGAWPEISLITLKSSTGKIPQHRKSESAI